jgi:hypothetical protein
LQDMVLRYTIILDDKGFGHVEHPLNPTREPESKSSIPPGSNDVQLTPSCVVSDARSGWESVGHGHVNINGVARDGKRSDSEHDLRVIRLPMRTHGHCWLCIMKGDEVSMIATDERSFAPADIGRIAMVACLARDALSGRREPNKTSSIATG